jgi:hypothetical protein
VNAAGREVRGRASAVSRFANVSLLVRAGGCNTISGSRSGAGTYGSASMAAAADLQPMRFD